MLSDPSWVNFYGEYVAMQELKLAYSGGPSFEMIDEFCDELQAAPNASEGPPPAEASAPKAGAKAEPVAGE